MPTETDEGKKATVYEHFGSAPYFTIYDTEKETFEIVNNSDQHHIHGACSPLGALMEKNIDTVVCGGMGLRALQALNDSGIRVFRAIAGTVGETIKKCSDNELQEIKQDDACGHHKCH